MSLLAAIAFLTILPVPLRRKLEPAYLGHSTRWYPLVGLGLGALLALGDWLLQPTVAQPARDALLVLAAILLTGGLHLDGLMDTCDGVFAPVSQGRRLEIMRDSHVGSFGIAGAGLILLGKYAALASLGPTPRWAALLAMAVLGRWAMSLAIGSFPAGRREGLGFLVQQAARPADVLFAGGLALLACAVLFGAPGVGFWLIVSLVAWLLGRFLTAVLGGLTGDAYGALNEVTELVALMLAPLIARWV